MLDSLAPRRKRLVLGVGAVVVAGAIAGTSVAVASDGGAAPVRPVAQEIGGPVLLIPGYGENTASLKTLQSRLRAAGKDASIVDLPDQALGDIDRQARAVRTAVDAAIRISGSSSVDLVGYSDGGVVARTYVRDLGGGSTVRRVVTLGSPQHGTDLAASADAFAPGVCKGACAQVLPNSDFLRALNKGDETPAGPVWVSMWTTQDRTVTPPDSARLAGAENIVLQDVCTDEQVSHGGLPSDPLVAGIVLASLGSSPPTAPTAGQCSSLRAAGGASGIRP